jgi:hypothetical protein
MSDEISAPMKTLVKTLAAVVYGQGEDANRVVADFAEELSRQGVRLGGAVQITAGAVDCGCPDTHVLDLETGVRIPILQDLGKQSQSCRADPAALAEVAALVTQALARRPDLLIINRFAKLEAAGQGMIDEIGAAAASGIPTLLSVPDRFLKEWNAFALGLDEQIACTPEALRRWWQAVSGRIPQEAAPQANGPQKRAALG